MNRFVKRRLSKISCLAASGLLNLSAISYAQPKVLVGWPQTLPGSISGTPVVADVDGDGKLEVVAPAMGRWEMKGLRHPEPTLAAQLWALGRDGKTLTNWPITLRDVESRLADRKKDAGLSETWYASPSVWDINGDGADEIAMVSGGHEGRDTRVLYGDGGNLQIAAEGDAWATIPLCDLDDDGIPDIAMGFVVTSILGDEVKTWPKARAPLMAYGSAMGDVDNDGVPEVFMPFYERDWHLPGAPENHTMGGFDNAGQPLAGWPQKMPSIALYLAVGDVTGDENKEIVSVDRTGQIHVWTHDGQELWGGAGKVQKEVKILAQQPALADLDGDGKAEIVVCAYDGSLRAWRGDGTPWRSENADGIIADGVVATRADGLNSTGAVSVVDLGGDGVVDFFCGTSWIRAGKTGEIAVESLLPAGENGTNGAGCTVVDFNGDGNGEVIFGLEDGRVWVVQTGLKWLKQTAQWPTPGGNFQHTGFWHDPRAAR